MTFAALVAGVMAALTGMAALLTWARRRQERLAERRWLDELMSRPKAPCAHRFIKAKFSDDGHAKVVCDDCGQPVTNVRLRIAEEYELEPGEKGAAVVIVKPKDPMEED